MAMVRRYRLQVSPGSAAALRTALTALVDALGRIEGFEEATLLADADVQDSYAFCERWASREAYEAGAKRLPKEMFGALMRTLATPPDATTFVTVPLDERD